MSPNGSGRSRGRSISYPNGSITACGVTRLHSHAFDLLRVTVWHTARTVHRGVQGTNGRHALSSALRRGSTTPCRVLDVSAGNPPDSGHRSGRHAAPLRTRQGSRRRKTRRRNQYCRMRHFQQAEGRNVPGAREPRRVHHTGKGVQSCTGPTRGHRCGAVAGVDCSCFPVWALVA
jgi:hypothetical protein